MSSDDIDDNAAKKLAKGFERYVFDPKFVLESESWQQAEEKIKQFLTARKARGDEPSPYFEANRTLWHEYQFLFLCQIIEFKLTEVIDRLRVAGKLKSELLAKLQTDRKADSERAKNVRRLTSPASLLEDFGFGLGDLMRIIKNETSPFDGKECLLGELAAFNTSRVKFIHHSFGGKESAGTDIATPYNQANVC